MTKAIFESQEIRHDRHSGKFVLQLSTLEKLKRHFASAHYFSWPVDLTRLHKIEPRGAVHSHKVLHGAKGDKQRTVFGPEIAAQEIAQIFRRT